MTALLGGGLALGGGTASAQEHVPDPGSSAATLAAGSAAGSAEFAGPDNGCSGYWEGMAGPGCLGPYRILPDDLGVVVRAWLKALPSIASQGKAAPRLVRG